MGINSNPSQLDNAQIIKKVFEAANDSIRVTFEDQSELIVSIDANDGDSVTTYNRSIPQKASIDNTFSSVVLGPFDASGMHELRIVTNTTATIVGAQVLTVQISPSDSDNVWIDTSLTVTPSLVSGTAVAPAPLSSLVCRRVRVKSAAAITSGTYDVYVVAQGS